LPSRGAPPGRLRPSKPGPGFGFSKRLGFFPLGGFPLGGFPPSGFPLGGFGGRGGLAYSGARAGAGGGSIGRGLARAALDFRGCNGWILISAFSPVAWRAAAAKRSAA